MSGTDTSSPALLQRETALMALRESPPRRMKSSSMPTSSIPRAARNYSQMMRSLSLRGAAYAYLIPETSGTGRDLRSTFPLTFSGIWSSLMTKDGTM